MKLFISLFLICLIVGCKSNGQKKVYPMPKMGMKYVHFWKHSDSLEKIIFDSAGNYKKQWLDVGDRLFNQAAAIDNLDDSIYRVKYHFSDYYYMWNYTDPDGDSEGWGENEITLDHIPTEAEIKDYVWNTCFSPKERAKYSCLEITGIEVKSSNRNTLQNMPLDQKENLQHGRSTYRLLQ